METSSYKCEQMASRVAIAWQSAYLAQLTVAVSRPVDAVERLPILTGLRIIAKAGIIRTKKPRSEVSSATVLTLDVEEVVEATAITAEVVEIVTVSSGSIRG